MSRSFSHAFKLGSYVLSSSFLLTISATALAEDQTAPLPTVVVTGSEEVESATTQAPTLAPLTVTQPTSLISQHFIENNSSLSSNYDDIIKIAPSVYSVSPNGP